MGSTNDKESVNTYKPGNKVLYKCNDDKLKTGTIISIGSFAKIKDSNTNIIQFDSLNIVSGHL